MRSPMQLGDYNMPYVQRLAHLNQATRKSVGTAICVHGQEGLLLLLVIYN